MIPVVRNTARLSIGIPMVSFSSLYINRSVTVYVIDAAYRFIRENPSAVRCLKRASLEIERIGYP